MTTETPWRDWYAWRPVWIDGIRHWLCTVQRCRIIIPEAEGYGAWGTVSGWQYRVKP